MEGVWSGCCRYLSNTAMLLLNKHLLGGYGFRYPVFLTACHMAACVVMSQARLPPLSEPPKLLVIACVRRSQVCMYPL